MGPMLSNTNLSSTAVYFINCYIDYSQPNLNQTAKYFNTSACVSVNLLNLPLHVKKKLTTAVSHKGELHFFDCQVMCQQQRRSYN